MENFLKLIFILIGFSGHTAQILLLRELLIVFSGNEFSIGIILSSWLLIEAIGSYLSGKLIQKDKNIIRSFILLGSLFFLFFPLSIFLIRIIKIILGISIGEGLGFIEMVYSSFILLFPASFIHGAQFPYSCKVYYQFTNKDVTCINNAYVFITFGVVLSGFFLTYFMIPYFNSFKIVSIIGLIAIFTLIIFLFNQKVSSAGSLSIFLFFLILFYLYLFLNGAEVLQWLSIRKQWKNQKILEYKNSIYSNICVVKYENQYTFFVDGMPKIITPIPDIMFVEEFVHIPLLLHPSPKKILTIGGAVGGIINEVLKHPTVEEVSYVEQDPTLLELIQKYPTELTEKELKNEKVKIHYLDGRFFIRQTKEKYDIILSGISNPSDLQSNRFFTEEFFKLIKEKLTEKGIFVLTLPGSLTYLSEELKKLNKVIYDTLKEVFKEVVVLPGDGVNIFLVSDTPDILVLSKEILVSKVKQRKIKAATLLPRHIEYKTNPYFRKWYLTMISEIPFKKNTDFKPTALFFSLSHWNSLFSPYLRKFFDFFETLNFLKLFSVIAAIFIVFILFFHKKLSFFSIPFSITTSGFVGMVFDVSMILAFQSIYGYIYLWIGLLVSFYMLGSACGAYISSQKFSKRKDFVLLELFILFFCIFLILIVGLINYCLEKDINFEIFKWIFLFINFTGGFLVGAEFPLGARIYLNTINSFSKTAGLINACDLFGGFVGGLIASIIFFPIFGIFNTLIFLVIVKIFSAFLVILTK